MKVSVVIPTLNERARLEKAVARLRLTSRPADIEVVVADGGSSDGTERTARREEVP